MKHDFTNKHSENESHLDVCLVSAGLRLTITTHTAISGWFNPAQAPAIALAVLEAAGAHKDSQDFLGGAVEQLRFHIGEQERATAEARERAELEAEALELRRAWDGVRIERLSDLTKASQEKWLAVARRARELAKEATK